MSVTDVTIQNVRTKNGNRGIMIMVPFEGGTHRFHDHKHAQNFVRYLFSQSKAHPQSADTARNLLREIDPGGNGSKEYYNHRPGDHMFDFMSRRFPMKDAHKKLADDGCYPLFLIQTIGAPIISNFVSFDGTHLVLDHPMLPRAIDDLNSTGQNVQRLFDSITKFVGSDPITDFDTLKDPFHIRNIDIFVNTVIQHALGNPSRVIMTATHRDQEERNPVYHVHRLIYPPPDPGDKDVVIPSPFDP